MPSNLLRHSTRFVVALAALSVSSSVSAATRYVATTGVDAANNCTNEGKPCRSITRGIATLAAGDTLIVGDGTYAESITNMPSGTAAAYTTIRAAHDWGVLIDGSAFPNTFRDGIRVSAKSYVHLRGFRVKMNQASQNNMPIAVPESHHIKIERCSASHGATFENATSIGVGPASHDVLIEECFAFGGARYQFLVYQSENVVVRRSVARNDYWNGSLQCAGFVNYDSKSTAWHDNIVLDSDTAHCSGRLFGGFWNENKPTEGPDTSQSLAGNIVLNVQAYYAGDLDWLVSGTRTIRDMVIWGSAGGYHGDQGDGPTASVHATRMTIGALTGKYDGPNGSPARGTGFSVYGNVTNSLTNSILAGCNSLGVADYTRSDFNVFSGNGADYGGFRKATPGANDRSSANNNALDAPASGLRYLPRIEPNSPLKTAGKDGGQIGAEIVFKTGVPGTLYGEPGWDKLTTEPLWPFPNEDHIRQDMAAYNGPGAKGARGFATGNSLDGTPQTLTKYVWEYLGNQIPSEVYELHIVGLLPAGVVGTPYSASVGVGGGTRPYTRSLKGALPDGLSFDPSNGAISGTPTRAGTTTFTMEATDSSPNKDTVTKELSLVIAPAGSGDGGVGDGGEGAANGPNGNGAAPGEGSDDDGCNCRAGAHNATGVAIPVLGTLVALLLTRRRRARA